jgi:hypothetical protein
MADPFAQLEERHGMSKPQRFQFDNTRREYDGKKLAGEFVDEREFEYADQIVPSKVIRTRDGTYRDLALWPATDQDGGPLEPREYHLPQRWEAAAPKIGDYVAVELELKDSARGTTYGDFTVTVLRREEIEEALVKPAGLDQTFDRAKFEDAPQDKSDESDPIPF